MTKASFAVKTYQYYDWSSRKTLRSNLILTGVGGEHCAVWFKEDMATAPPPAENPAPNRYDLYYYHNDFQHLIDMLRNEKPIFVFYNDEFGLPNSLISTTDEPTGEGEQT